MNFVDQLFYVKEPEEAAVLADIPPNHHPNALKKGMRDLVEEYDPYILLKVSMKKGKKYKY